MSARPRVVLYNPRAVFYTMPLALLALASALDRRRYDVLIVDGRLERDPVGRLLEAAEGAVCVGLTVLTGGPIRDALLASRAVKTRHPGCAVIWGGWHPSLFASDCLTEPAVDIAVIGQGERTFVEIVDRLVGGEPIPLLPGTAVRAGDLAVIGPPRPFADLNDLARHDYGLIPVERYFRLKGKRQIDYISSQGCRFRCAFCADPAVYGRGWTGLAPERIADELAFLCRHHGVHEVAFQDETFFTSPTRIEQLVDEFLARRVNVSWTATLRADQACRLGEALFGRAVRAGLRRVMVGVESGDQATLDRLKKDMRVTQAIETAELCVRHDVGAIFNFIVGFPGESDASVHATLALAKRLRGMHARFETPIFYYRPYPGNPLAEQAARDGYAFPRGLEAWAEFDYVGGPGPWTDASRWRHVERFKFYNRQASQPGSWRWPIRAAARWRCDRDWFDYPVEKALVELVRRPSPVS